MNVPKKRQGTVRRSPSWIDKSKFQSRGIKCLLCVVAERAGVVVRCGMMAVVSPSSR